MTQPYPSTIRMDSEIISDRRERERIANRDMMQWMIERARVISGEEEEDDDLSDLTKCLTSRDGRNTYGGDHD
jgi:hypothetical protein